MWPCHVYSSVNRWIWRVYSSVTDEYTRQGPRGTAQVYLSVNRRIYLGFETVCTPFFSPPLSHFKMSARAKRLHAAVASAPRRRRPRPEPASAAATPGHRCPRPEMASPLPVGAAPGTPGPLRLGPAPLGPPSPPTAGRRSPPPPFLFFEV
jgi:hypothetical protein